MRSTADSLHPGDRGAETEIERVAVSSTLAGSTVATYAGPGETIMKKLCALAALLAGLTVSANLGARSTESAPCVAHTHGAPVVSDPDPSSCLLCAGDPAVHIRALWAIQKLSARAFVLRFL